MKTKHQQNKAVLSILAVLLLAFLIYQSPRQLLVRASQNDVRVSKIIDGDTIELSSGQQVRYIGIDTPEIGQPGATEAIEMNRELLKDKTIRLERDVLYKDRYDRILAYVWADDMLVNEELLKDGLAWPLNIPPDTKYQNNFIQAVKLAQKLKIGLWSNDGK